MPEKCYSVSYFKHVSAQRPQRNSVRSEESDRAAWSLQRAQ
jgi:hypothetical protein